MDLIQSSPEFFSISESGPVYKALLKLNLFNNKKRMLIVFLCITWLPLLIISAIEGTLYQAGQDTFLQDIAMHVRLLLALPMLLLIGIGIDEKVIEVKKYFSGTLMRDNDQQQVLSKVLKGTHKLINSAFAELILFLIVIIATISIGKGGVFNAEHQETGSWKFAFTDGKQALSYAGAWADYFSIPVYQFLLLRWLWRYIVWAVLLFRLSFTRLSLLATHPDKAGGLSLLMHAQKYLNMIFVTVSLVISGELFAKLLKAYLRFYYHLSSSSGN
jgi:hypothetical protein